MLRAELYIHSYYECVVKSVLVSKLRKVVYHFKYINNKQQQKNQMLWIQSKNYKRIYLYLIFYDWQISGPFVSCCIFNIFNFSGGLIVCLLSFSVVVCNFYSNMWIILDCFSWNLLQKLPNILFFEDYKLSPLFSLLFSSTCGTMSCPLANIQSTNFPWNVQWDTL